MPSILREVIVPLGQERASPALKIQLSISASPSE
jgi:hypothetical protein